MGQNFNFIGIRQEKRRSCAGIPTQLLLFISVDMDTPKGDAQITQHAA